MANSYFAFKQFTIRHDRCAMKVGTDGVLLGSVAPVDGALRVLDVGTGTGLIALMLAQRNAQARIDGVEIDREAAAQATENVSASPWSDRVVIRCADFNEFTPDALYDVVVSNPPYFVDSLLAPDKGRSQARHAAGLRFEDLLEGVVRCLRPQGVFSLILPTDVKDLFISLAEERGLYVNRMLWIQTTPTAEPKRIILNLSFQPTGIEESSLIVELERHRYSEEYISLTKDFYLKM